MTQAPDIINVDPDDLLYFNIDPPDADTVQYVRVDADKRYLELTNASRPMSPWLVAAAVFLGVFTAMLVVL